MYTLPWLLAVLGIGAARTVLLPLSCCWDLVCAAVGLGIPYPAAIGARGGAETAALGPPALVLLAARGGAVTADAAAGTAPVVAPFAGRAVAFLTLFFFDRKGLASFARQ